MVIDEKYYDKLDEELTRVDPVIDRDTQGYFDKQHASIVMLRREDTIIARELAKKANLSVSDYLSQTLKMRLAAG
ncbi:MAG: hypothetical protein LBL86_10625 [Coriobacteriales bacterium]|nr:hypothetical protein [Coriobacteriales bacterium]